MQNMKKQQLSVYTKIFTDSKTSENDESKSLFSLDFEKIEKKVPTFAGTQDELPCNESPEVLFSLP
jgi:hypothetical protein